MKKWRVVIDSAGARVSVVASDKELLESLKRSTFLRQYIPSCKIVKSAAPSAPQLNLEYGKPFFSLNYPRARYVNRRYEDGDIVTIIELLLERVREQGGIYCLHSSSVNVGDRGVIFWGGVSGLGKTRLALSLNEYSKASIYSDEKTLIDLTRNRMIGGVTTAYLSKPHLQGKFSGKTFHDFTPTRKAFPIEFFVYPNVKEGSKKFDIERWEPRKFSWHLYEELSRKIRGTSRRVFNSTLPVQSIDSHLIAQRRSMAVEAYAKRIPCYYMAGKEEAICENIIKLIKEGNKLSGTYRS